MLGHAEHRDQPAHSVEPEAPAERLERVRGSPRRRRATRLAVPLSGPSSSSSRPVASELLPLRLDHVGRRLRDESLVRELPLGARHLRRSASRRSSMRWRRLLGIDLLGGEDLHRRRTWRSPRPRRRRDSSRASRADELVRAPRRRRARRRQHAARRHPDEVPPAAHRGASARSQRRPPARPARRSASGSTSGKAWTTSTRPRRELGQIGVDLLGHERHHRVSSASICSSTQRSVARGVLVAVVEPRLDDLEVPVAELRPEELVEVERRVGEVVGLEVRRSPTSTARWRRESDPPVLDALGARRRAPRRRRR